MNLFDYVKKLYFIRGLIQSMLFALKIDNTFIVHGHNHISGPKSYTILDKWALVSSYTLWIAFLEYIQTRADVIWVLGEFNIIVIYIVLL